MKDYSSKQGDMTPYVEDYERPKSTFSQQDENKTLSYVKRQDATVTKEASTLKRTAYKGRYS